jgi:hypothetical protein
MVHVEARQEPHKTSCGAWQSRRHRAVSTNQLALPSMHAFTRAAVQRKRETLSTTDQVIVCSFLVLGARGKQETSELPEACENVWSHILQGW